jgi:hypothetical protein
MTVGEERVRKPATPPSLLLWLECISPKSYALEPECSKMAVLGGELVGRVWVMGQNPHEWKPCELKPFWRDGLACKGV